MPSAAARRKATEGDGSAVFDGAPKPYPHDEFGAAAYHREPDSRTDPMLMLASGIGAASGRGADDAEIAESKSYTPESAQLPSEAGYSKYDALKQAHADAISPQPSELSDLMPANARADAQAEFAGTAQEAGNRKVTDATLAQDDMSDLMPPNIRDDVTRANNQRSQQRTTGLGL